MTSERHIILLTTTGLLLSAVTTSLYADAPSSSITSNAFNYKNGLSTSVNPRTLMLNVSMPLATLTGTANGNFSLPINIGYSQYGSQRYKMPGLSAVGWGITLPYVDNHSGSRYLGTLHFQDGESYHYKSDYSLAYYPLKNIAFGRIASPKASACGDQYQFSYWAKNLAGTTDYFNSQGNIVCMADRFNHNIEFNYTSDSNNQDSVTLSSIQDSSGQRITFNFGSITLPNQSQLKISNSGGEIDISRQVGSTVMKTAVFYSPHKINRIVYPTGLTASFIYTPVSNTQQIERVSDSKLYYQSAAQPMMHTIYSTPRGNFIGPCTPKSGSDCLMDQNTNYTYTTQIESGALTTLNTYNHLHLMIKKIVKAGNTPASTQTYLYSGESQDGSNFDEPYYTISQNHPNFQKPASITTQFGAGAQTRTVSEQEVYDPLFGELKQKTNPNGTITAYSYDNPSNITLVDQQHYGLTLTQTTQTTDHHSRKTTNVLTGDAGENTEVQSSSLTQDGAAVNTSTYTYCRNNSCGVGMNGAIKSSTVTSPNEKISPSIQFNYATAANDATNSTLVTTEVDAENHHQTKIYSKATGKLLSITDALGNTTTYHYDAIGRLSYILYPNGLETSVKYTLTPGGPIPASMTKTTCQAGANGRCGQTYLIQKYDFNALGQVISQYDNDDIQNGTYLNAPTILRTTNHYGIDATSQQWEKLSSTMSDGNQTLVSVNYAYDPQGRVSDRHISGGDDIQTTYNDVTHTVTQTITPSATVSGDSNASVITTLNNMNQKVQTSVQPAGGANGQGVITTNHYDGFGQVHETDGPATKIVNLYDGAGNILTSTITDKSSGHTLTTNNQYDVLGNNQQSQVTVTGATKTAIGDFYTYSNSSELKTITEGTKTLQNNYDSKGQLTSSESLSGTYLNYRYNNLGQRTESFISDQPCPGDTCTKKTNDTTWTYYTSGPNTGAIQTVSNKTNGTLTYHYYSDGKLSSLTYPSGLSVKYSYNSAGQVESQTDVLGNVTTYHYEIVNGKQLMQSATQVLAASKKSLSVSYTYYPSGLLKSTTRGDLVTTYTYTALGEQQSITTTLKDKALRSLTYTYYPDGNIHTKQSVDSHNPTSNNTLTYSYDLGRLATITRASATQNAETVTVFQYDAAGNLLSRNKMRYRYNDINQIIGAAMVQNHLSTQLPSNKVNLHQPNTTPSPIKLAFVYDDNGNMQHDPNGNQYHYNELNQLLSFTNSSGTNYTDSYYANGLRATQTDGTTTLHYYYDANGNLINTISGNNDSSYLLGQSRVARSVNINSQTRSDYYVYNQHGSVVETINTQSDTVDQQYDYDEYGNNIETSKSDANTALSINNNPIQYAGYYFDQGSQLYYLQARFYSPVLHVFISRDSYNLLNRYNYAGANPIINIDPNGHDFFSGFANFVTNMFTQMIPDMFGANGAKQAGIAWAAFGISLAGSEAGGEIAGDAMMTGLKAASKLGVEAASSSIAVGAQEAVSAVGSEFGANAAQEAWADRSGKFNIGNMLGNTEYGLLLAGGAEVLGHASREGINYGVPEIRNIDSLETRRSSSGFAKKLSRGETRVRIIANISALEYIKIKSINKAAKYLPTDPLHGDLVAIVNRLASDLTIDKLQMGSIAAKRLEIRNYIDRGVMRHHQSYNRPVRFLAGPSLSYNITYALGAAENQDEQ